MPNDTEIRFSAYQRLYEGAFMQTVLLLEKRLDRYYLLRKLFKYNHLIKTWFYSGIFPATF